jgi:hypothetical protein
MSRSTARPSGALAAASTTTLLTGASTLNSITVTTDGTNAATVTVYDNTAASGKIMNVLVVTGASLYGRADFSNAIKGENGLTVTVVGTGATGYVTFGGA